MVFGFILSILILIAVIDARTYRIPDAMVSYIVLVTACGDIAEWDQALIAYRLLSACLTLSLFWTVYVTVGHLGFGDVKLVTALAYAFGFAYFLAAFLVSAIACLFAYYINVRRRIWAAKTRIPFAPFMLTGCAAVSIARGVMSYE